MIFGSPFYLSTEVRSDPWLKTGERIMYFPPYDQLIRAAKKTAAAGQESDRITLPLNLFKFLLQAALASADFNEEYYLAANPDVRKRLDNTRELSANQHYVGYGYFEGRRGGMPQVDEQWYLQTYPDVASAVKSGQVASASEHFEVVGAAEGRAPSRAYLDVASEWKILFK